MGNGMERLFQKRRVAVLMLGLKNSGKTTILYKLLTGENILPISTFGFNMEVIPFEDIELDVMEVGGDVKMVPLWKHYLTSALAMIYVIDCCDVERMEENKTLIADLVTRPERKGIPLLVVVNKTDSLNYKLTSQDLSLRLDLAANCKMRQYKVQMVSAETGEGLAEGFTWLCATLGSGNANKKLRRMVDKQAKNKRREARIKQIAKVSAIQADQSKSTSGSLLGVDTKLTASEPPRMRNGTIDDSSLNFGESYDRINAFFSEKLAKIPGLVSAEDLSTKLKPETEKTSDNLSLPALVDTFSSKPHNAVSPRRAGTMVRLQEFEGRQTPLQHSGQNLQQQEQRASSPRPEVDEQSPAGTREAFTKAASFLHSKTTASNPQGKPFSKQELQESCGCGAAAGGLNRAGTLPSVARSSGAAPESSACSKHSMTLPSACRMPQHQVGGNVIQEHLHNVSGICSPCPSQKLMDPAPLASDAVASSTTATPSGVSSDSIPDAGFRPSFFSMIATIKLQFSFLRSNFQSLEREDGSVLSGKNSHQESELQEPSEVHQRNAQMSKEVKAVC